MLKALFTPVFLCLCVYCCSQVIIDPNINKTNTSYSSSKGTGIHDDNWDRMFNNLGHPMAITGSALVLGGAGTYIAASIMNDKDAPLGQSRNGYGPTTTLHFVGIGIFVAGAVLFAIFSTERNGKSAKRKKNKTYNAADWQIPQE